MIFEEYVAIMFAKRAICENLGRRLFVVAGCTLKVGEPWGRKPRSSKIKPTMPTRLVNKHIQDALAVSDYAVLSVMTRLVL